jgi:hypothetical protein
MWQVMAGSCHAIYLCRAMTCFAVTCFRTGRVGLGRGEKDDTTRSILGPKIRTKAAPAPAPARVRGPQLLGQQRRGSYVREAFDSARSEALVVSCHLRTMSGRGQPCRQGSKIRSPAAARHHHSSGTHRQGVADLRQGCSLSRPSTPLGRVSVYALAPSALCRVAPWGHGGSRDSRSELVDCSVRVLLGF